MNVLLQELFIIILSAGKGKRMFTSIPKVLHKLAGKPILQHIIDKVLYLKAKKINIVYGYEGKLLRKKIISRGFSLNWTLQSEQNGTGHAVQQVIFKEIGNDNDKILILYGDVPLISINTLRKLLYSHSGFNISLLTAVIDSPDGYGRIIRKNGKISKIIEHEDALSIDKNIREINTGVMVVNRYYLRFWLNKLLNKRNKDKEIYLTDIISIAYKSGNIINSVQPEKVFEIFGINNRFQLMKLEKIYQIEQAKKLLLNGVTLSDYNRFDLRGTLKHGKDIFIDINVVLKGSVIIGDRVKIGNGCVLKNVIINNDVIIHPYSIIEDACLDSNSVIGPFAHIHSKSKIKKNVHVGNFVEIKNTIFGKNSKVGHLSYLGDSDIGKNVNIGAGTITCNFDGKKKNKTIIKNNVFIGANSELIAPVIINSGAVVGAGTTVTKNINRKDKIISRIRQFSILRKENNSK
ncbi:glmU [Wigglesworthia glossinidia endosymbiont of Glossina brevipalpis]|uniref:Bifunctional protein GlmU n=1 Tax=Wigglesworthia glossinidia brevipalpis TaxID=36870 RepID=GLMU_WIGBR|nr:RecName: Full=Bifunctional protein GlmU; Includes: RecName: Full=UDP-N-acetylglucosamine pyrophosphorylase; AltName: Full=N-acetylglucosamine-1-phosphate uridyltransferase; Includes: RecName: Full=Glucosamine-1-phosphate N-acetyltransferase [Wigglesworthia glossinidia endosymbiont of Glossina brevipalpis]BAC24156.1 glmU [Wigglesworthia glossinidia endosymbiont of Glossina brevipalpis]